MHLVCNAPINDNLIHGQTCIVGIFAQIIVMKTFKNLARYYVPPLAISALLAAQTAYARVQVQANDQDVPGDTTAPEERDNQGDLDNQTGQDDDETLDDDTIIVRAVRGAVDTDIPALQEFNAEDIASLGAGSLEELIAAISPQASSGRGRGSGRPIFLLNGQRISSFRELRDLPPEAIQRVQIFPEELALQYGFSADQRVINFILVDNFNAFTGELEYGEATQGGRGQGEIEGTFTRIQKGGRLNIDVEYSRSTALTEDERNIIQPDNPQADLLVASDPNNIGAFRTLLPENETIEANASYGKEIATATRLQLNASFTDSSALGLNGLNSTIFDLPATSPFNNGGVDQSVLRIIAAPRPLEQQTNSQTIAASAAVTGNIKRTNWSLTADYQRAETDTIIDQAADFAALQAQIDAGLIDPLAAGLGADLPPPGQNFAQSVLETLTLNANVRSQIAYLPSGPVNLTLNAGLVDIGLDTENIIAGIASEASLKRTDVSGSINLTIPLSERDGVVPAIGALSINGNIGFRDLSDFGGLLNYGFGLNWGPSEELSFQLSFIGSEAAPTIGQLGNPVIVSPNVPIFDFATNSTVFASVISGGNAALLQEERRDVRISANYRPASIEGLTFNAEFFRNRSFNTANNFPTFTPEIEAAFPDRIVRDGAGSLISLDRRPVNFGEVQSDSLRYGIIFFKRFGASRRPGGRPGGFGGPGRGRGGARPDAGSTGASAGTASGGTASGRTASGGANGAEPAQAAARGRPTDASANTNANASNNSEQSERGSEAQTNQNSRQQRPARSGGFFGSQPGSGRWNLSVFHRIRFNENVLIAPGIAPLDLLNGSSVSGSTGAIRHSVELEGGWFKDGLGFRVEGNFDGPSQVDGGGLNAGSPTLDFGAIATFNLRAFLNFDNREKITKALPFLRGSRLALRVNNVFDAQQDVRDQDGNMPLQFQPAFRDPLGRFVELSWRKRF